MPFDPDPDDEQLVPRRPLPADDRLWRHPSELGIHGPGAPSTWPAGAPAAGPSPDRTGRAIGMGLVLIGAVVTLGSLWLTRPGVEPSSRRGTAARAALASTTTAASAATTIPMAQLIERVAPSVAHLEIQQDGVWIHATALWVDDRGTLAASAPALASASQIYVIGIDGRRQLARIIGSDAATGVTALAVARTAGTPIEVAGDRPRSGAPATVIARAATGPTAAADGVVREVSERAIVGSHVYHDAIRLDRPLPDGTAGSALVDADGAVTGMVVGNAEGEVATIAPVDTVVDATSALRDGGELRRAVLGVRAVDHQESTTNRLLTAAGSGARLIVVDAAGPGAAAGLQVDDVVTAVAGTRVSDASELVAALRGRAPGELVVVELERAGQRLRLTVELG